ncbi:MAG: hypothetical protein IV086_15130 [Hyphomonadaceae bacterium]|nr:MAG: serine/threonine protein kinase [Caulobacteraceae bacterium]MBT9447033.1 hypothetical protein [Hyphomonadaceae bacterium]TPW06265.1 MAG: serine/threonine protein kinase [Alphaproteobacteria bacterium]
MSKPKLASAVCAAAVLATGFATGLAAAQGPRAAGGQWSGAYTCSQGLTGMTVDLRPLRGEEMEATVTFYAHPDNPGVESGCYGARGTLDRETGRLVLRPTRWISRPGPGWSMTTLEGRIDANGAYAGRVVYAGDPRACRGFALRRNARPLNPPPPACAADAPMS